MPEPDPFVTPLVTADDIHWACEILGLPANAFHGVDGNDPRQHVISSLDSLDIEACPGSGKTTLLVAKLAILARKWPDTRRGICVLSHTNVAREEIESCLGHSPEGQKLLSYPHYIGTIHGFINHFLAVPWLRSLGYPATTFDNDLCEKHRRRLLQLNQFSVLNVWVQNRERMPHTRVVQNWHLDSPEFLVVRENGDSWFANANARSAVQLRDLARQCVKDGYHRYEEVFMWAHDLLSKKPEVAIAIRQRFPLLFVDEVQDNSEDQSALLHRVFIEGNGPVTRQRFGDSNQAIYGYEGQQGAQSDVFPQDVIRTDIPNSHRFSQQIADVADPLGLVPQAMRGQGPPASPVVTNTTDKNAIFLFADEAIGQVLDRYAAYLIDVFNEDELSTGRFTAVGAVHRPSDEPNPPRSVGNYWEEYDHELTSSEPRPTTLVQYVMIGRAALLQTKESQKAVEKLADGLLRLTRLANTEAHLSVRRRKHIQILEALQEDHAAAREAYLQLVTRLIDPTSRLTSESWRDEWCERILIVARALAGSEVAGLQVDAFLGWPEDLAAEEPDRPAPKRDNVFNYPPEAPVVSIQLGSIHSVKGETHTATLVLETYYYGHHLQRLKPWLLGQNAGHAGGSVRVRSGLKQHYVAMTRPTHLLCIAMRDILTEEEIEILKGRTWRVARVANGDIQWL